MEMIVDGVNYKTSLRWLYGSKLSKTDFREFTDKYSARGVYYKSNDFMSYGVQVKDDEQSTLPSLACTLAKLKSNAVIFLKGISSEGDVYYWGSMISNGVPVIDYASSNLDSVVAPILKRLTEPGGDKYIYVDSPSLMFDDSISEELEENASFNKLLFVRSNLNKLSLNFNEIKSIKTPNIHPLKFGLIGGSTEKKPVNIVFTALLAFLVVFLFVLFSKDDDPVFIPLKKPVKSLVVEKKDFTSEAATLFSQYMQGNDPYWSIYAYDYVGGLPRNIGPFIRVSAECLVASNACLVLYSRTGVRDYGDVLKKLEDQRVDFELDFNATVLKIQVPLSKSPSSSVDMGVIDSFGGIREILYLRHDVKQRSSMATIEISEPEVLSIGAKASFFSSLDDTVKEKLNFARYGIKLKGASKHHLSYLIEGLKTNPNFLIRRISRNFDSSSAGNWDLVGEYLVNIKEGLVELNEKK